MAVNKEKCVVVDDNNEIIGYKNRDDLDPIQDRWRISSVLLFNSSNQVLLAKRDRSKKTHPGLWGPTSAGTLEQNESVEESAHKELLEETGINSVALTFLGYFFYEAGDDKRFLGLFKGSCDMPLENMTPEASEVSELKWIDISVLKRDIIDNPSQYVPGLNGVLNAFGIDTPPLETEFVHIVNAENELQYFKPRSMTSDTDAFRISAVIIEDCKGNTLSQKRSQSKNTGPGKWENAAGGVVNSSETPEQNAHKELFEEIGIENITLKHIAVTVVKTRRGDRHCYWYKGVLNKDEWPHSRFVLEKGSVDAIKWIKTSDLLTDRDKNPEKYMPSSTYWRELF